MNTGCPNTDPGKVEPIFMKKLWTFYRILTIIQSSTYINFIFIPKYSSQKSRKLSIEVESFEGWFWEQISKIEKLNFSVFYGPF